MINGSGWWFFFYSVHFTFVLNPSEFCFLITDNGVYFFLFFVLLSTITKSAAGCNWQHKIKSLQKQAKNKTKQKKILCKTQTFESGDLNCNWINHEWFVCVYVYVCLWWFFFEFFFHLGFSSSLWRWIFIYEMSRNFRGHMARILLIVDCTFHVGWWLSVCMWMGEHFINYLEELVSRWDEIDHQFVVSDR